MTGQRAGWAVVRETHTAAVFLVGDRAYKLKKPVALGFVDFSTRPARLAACRREVELNRRLAADVYLGVADVTGPDGHPCDHLVVMRRMPEECRLSRLVRDGLAGDAEVRRVARLVAAFHAGARRGSLISAEGSRDALRGRWTASFEQVRPFHGDVLEPLAAGELERLALRFLDGRDPLLAERIRAGRVVDGHGDLLADDIFCLPDGPRVLDCLEFDDRLRYLDQLDDAAFLAMDLESLGAPDLASRYLDYYLEFSADPAPASLLAHYLAYRAFVRVKVDCLRHAQGDPDAAAAARALLDLALRHLREGTVRMVLVGGLPGTGKSRLSGGLADRLGMVVISSDRVRKELAGMAPDTPAAAAYRQGLYTRERTECTYREVIARARAALTRGESVVLDASWTDAAHRDAANALAEQTHTDLIALVCTAPAPVAVERTRGRAGPSDAGPDVAAAMATEAAPWPQAHVVDTTASAGEVLVRALAVVSAVPG